MKYAEPTEKSELESGQLCVVDTDGDSFVAMATMRNEDEIVVSLSPAPSYESGPGCHFRNPLTHDVLSLKDMGYEWVVDPRDARLNEHLEDRPGDVIFAKDRRFLCFRNSKAQITELAYIDLDSGKFLPDRPRGRQCRYRKWSIARELYGQASTLTEFPFADPDESGE